MRVVRLQTFWGSSGAANWHRHGRDCITYSPHFDQKTQAELRLDEMVLWCDYPYLSPVDLLMSGANAIGSLGSCIFNRVGPLHTRRPCKLWRGQGPSLQRSGLRVLGGADRVACCPPPISCTSYELSVFHLFAIDKPSKEGAFRRESSKPPPILTHISPHSAVFLQPFCGSC